MGTAPISVRPIRAGDRHAIHGLARRAFAPFLSWLMRSSMHLDGFVAERQAQVIGAITVKQIRVGQEHIGVLEWVVVDPSEQTRGIGRMLLERSLAQLQMSGCDRIVTTDVDAYNSPSWKLCIALGFRRWTTNDQIRAFGWQWPQLLIKIPHFGIGTFVLRYDPAATPAQRPGGGSLAVVALFLGFVLLPLSRVRELMWDTLNVDALTNVGLESIIAGFMIVVLYIAARAVGHWIAAARAGLGLVFRPWVSGNILAALLAIMFSPFIPALAGGPYVADQRFDYKRERAVFGPIIAGGVGASILVLALCTLASALIPALASIAELGRRVGFAFAITDTVLVFAPMDGLPAGHLWRWNRLPWLGVVGAYLVLLVVG